jgi:alpha-beta hydrolase superfamily lysophospholipase
MPAGSPHQSRSHLRSALYALSFALLGGFATLVVIAIFVINQKPDLSVWHYADLDAEFTEKAPVNSWQDYLVLEDRLFAQLQSDVYGKIADSEHTAFNRYNAGSKSDPGIWPRNWNRTFELPATNARYGVLLLHGYSDSPYSLRGLGQILHREGAHVLGLRIPGHGTAPSGLKHAVFEDMAAAVRLAMRHLKDQLGNRPLFIIGYSNGGALAIHYSLNAVENANLPRPAGIVLISPEIGVTPAAALARWQAWIGDMLGLDKLAWNSVQPEYDPFKYNSFAVNAGEQTHRLTGAIQSQLDQLEKLNRLDEIPAILAFQSAVDATVSAPAVLSGLFDRLKAGKHQLMVFDVNRRFEVEGLLKKPIDLNRLLSGPSRPYSVGVVTNRDEESTEVVLRERLAGEKTASLKALGVAWPQDVYSLSHIALPFAPDDPVYGNDIASENPGVRLGRVALRGENRTLAIPTTAMTRQHWNPFFAFLSDRVRAFITGLSGLAGTPQH